MAVSGGQEGHASARRWQAVVPVGLGAALASLLLFSWLAEEVLEQHTQRFDESVRRTIHQYSSPTLTASMRRITQLGDWMVVVPAVLCLWAIFSWRGAKDFVRLLLLTMTGALLLDGALKLVFHRARPDPFFVAKPPSYSFPSGHSLVSLCFYGLLAGMVNLRLKKRWQRVGVWTLAVLVVGSIGLSRIYLGVHWPSDVLAGYAAAIVWMGALRVLAPKPAAEKAEKL